MILRYEWLWIAEVPRLPHSQALYYAYWVPSRICRRRHRPGRLYFGRYTLWNRFAYFQLVRPGRLYGGLTK